MASMPLSSPKVALDQTTHVFPSGSVFAKRDRRLPIPLVHDRRDLYDP